MRALGAQCWMVASAKRKLLTICTTIAPGDMKKKKKLLLQQTTGVPWNNSRRRISLSLSVAHEHHHLISVCILGLATAVKQQRFRSCVAAGLLVGTMGLDRGTHAKTPACLFTWFCVQIQKHICLYIKVCVHLCMVRVCIWDTAAACLPAR